MRLKLEPQAIVRNGSAHDSGAGLKRSVVISNGVSRFPLAVAAAEVNRVGRLAELVTGGYPTRRVKRTLAMSGLGKRSKPARLLGRQQPIDDALIRPLWVPELLHEIAVQAQAFRVLRPVATRVDALSFKIYGREAARSVVAARGVAGIYHYRSGFGRRSAIVAQE
jgi:hypothetical protein